VRRTYTGTILGLIAPRSEAWAPAQQQAQVEVANIVRPLSHAADDGVKPTRRRAASLSAIESQIRTRLVAAALRK
jgi:hypothetical protein